ncbi:DUF2726 domain-containing protein [Prosthecobacter sp.]|uniref:DUF2726 domain-containing protein n=1 Tax=Prosthecobacter sp. TaxID=1965333 RepID=UPI001D626C2C|nr:DUF2726 domain-containing protein [Prosthecobacter sp.]MCB1277896.1 DUF2726 domain-containing protein [Prosthecobacter sp.]
MQLIAPDPDMRLRFKHPYASKPLLTETEARFFECLFQITQGRCHIQVKPRLADVFQHPKVPGAFQRISQKHVDFLICRADDWMPMVGIEVDDPSHGDAKAFKNDIFKNELFAATGVPLLRLPVYELGQLEELVATLTRAWNHRWAILETGMPPPLPKPRRRFIDRLMGKSHVRASEAA